MTQENQDVFFSVIMPTYNRAFCIAEAVDAVLKQTFPNFELIIIDDGSSDNTEELLNTTYADEINAGKIVYFKQPANKGVCAARNKGLELAKNDWIAYVDTDNIPTIDFLETFAKAIKEHKSECYYAKIFHIRSKSVVGSKFKYKNLLKGNLVDLGAFVHSKKLYKKLGGFDTRLTRLVDWDLVLTYTKNNPPCFIDKVVLAYNDTNRFSRISNTGDHDKNLNMIWKKHAGIFRKLFNKKKKGETRMFTFFGIPFSYRKNAHYIRTYYNELYAKLSPNTKTYDHVFSLGRNCEFSYQFHHYFRFLESSLFAWGGYFDKEKFPKALQNLPDLLSGDVEELGNHNIWKFNKYDVAFHGRALPSDLLDDDGKPDREKRQKEVEELRSRIAHLTGKFQKAQQSGEKILYTITVLREENETEQQLIDFAKNTYDTLMKNSKNADFLVILEQNEYNLRWKELEKHPHFYIRTLAFFTPRNAVTTFEKSDYKSWMRLFREFRQKQVAQNPNKKFKFE